MTRISDTVREHTCSFTTSPQFLFKMRNVLDKILEEIKQSFRMFKQYLPTTVPFMR